MTDTHTKKLLLFEKIVKASALYEVYEIGFAEGKNTYTQHSAYLIGRQEGRKEGYDKGYKVGYEDRGLD